MLVVLPHDRLFQNRNEGRACFRCVIFTFLYKKETQLNVFIPGRHVFQILAQSQAILREVSCFPASFSKDAVIDLRTDQGLVDKFSCLSPDTRPL